MPGVTLASSSSSLNPMTKSGPFHTSASSRHPLYRGLRCTTLTYHAFFPFYVFQPPGPQLTLPSLLTGTQQAPSPLCCFLPAYLPSTLRTAPHVFTPGPSEHVISLLKIPSLPWLGGSSTSESPGGLVNTQRWDPSGIPLLFHISLLYL